MIQVVGAEVAVATAPLVARDHAVAIQIHVVEADAPLRLRHQRGAREHERRGDEDDPGVP